MSSKMKNLFTSVSDTVFPGSRRIIETNVQHNQSQAKLHPGNVLYSNLGLQMALYFNCYFSPIWLFVCLVLLSLKYDNLGPYYKFILIVVYFVMTALELVRLFLGYSGNLQEKIPELAGFWLLTVILQFPLICFLLFNEHTKVLPMERSLHIIMFLFMLFEIIQGYRSIKHMTDSQVQKFHLRRFQEEFKEEKKYQ